MIERPLIRISCDIEQRANYKDFKPFQGDLKSLSTENYEKLEKSIIKHGVTMPTNVWEDDGTLWILDGHQRNLTYEAMEKKGFVIPPIPYTKIEAPTYELAKEILLTMVSQYGMVEKDGLYEFVTVNNIPFEVLVNDYRIPDVNMESFKVEYFDDNTVPPGEDPGAGEPPIEPITKSGDIWLLGKHRLICADSTNVDDIEKLMDGQKATLVFTDPPYNLAGENQMQSLSELRPKSYGRLKNSSWDVSFSFLDLAGSLEYLMGPNCSVYVCTSHHLLGEILNWMKISGEYYGLCVWEKPNPMPSMSKRHWTWATEFICYMTKGKHIFNFPELGHASSVWHFPKTRSNDLHPTMKPVELCEHPISHSSNMGDLVVDLFGGSGSTLIACEKLNRKCFISEISPAYCDVIINRFEKMTGQKAVLA